jgi:hypothetical protein
VPGTTKLRVAYRDTTNKSFKLASCDSGCGSGGWSLKTIADVTSNNYGRDAVIASDPATGLRIAYYDDANSLIRILAGDVAVPFSTSASFAGPSAPSLSLVFGAGATHLGFNSGTLKVYAGP